jgi:hypothetical protein
MEDLKGLPLSNALSLIQEKYHIIINIVKLLGRNSKFNNLQNPYVIKFEGSEDDLYITLFVAYY